VHHKRRTLLSACALVLTVVSQANAACEWPIYRFPASWNLWQSNGVRVGCSIIPNRVDGFSGSPPTISFIFSGGCWTDKGVQGPASVTLSGKFGDHAGTLDMTVRWNTERAGRYVGTIDFQWPPGPYVQDGRLFPAGILPIDHIDLTPIARPENEITWTADPLICPRLPFEPPSCSSCHNNESRQWHQGISEISREKLWSR
jgi:hypothetical protein